MFNQGETIFVVDEDGGTFSFHNDTDQTKFASSERESGSVNVTTFTVTAPRDMTDDEAADFACSHGPEKG